MGKLVEYLRGIAWFWASSAMVVACATGADASHDQSSPTDGTNSAAGDANAATPATDGGRTSGNANPMGSGTVGAPSGDSGIPLDPSLDTGAPADDQAAASFDAASESTIADDAPQGAPDSELPPSGNGDAAANDGAIGPSTPSDAARDAPASDPTVGTPIPPADANPCSSPAGGTPFVVDGGSEVTLGAAAVTTVEAENYDRGGPCVGYQDSTPGNALGQYRNDDVDIEKRSEERRVGKECRSR